jgi:hypothetical protein
VSQISNYRIIQQYLLFNRLPASYTARSSVLYDFLRKLEMSFEIKQVDADHSPAVTTAVAVISSPSASPTAGSGPVGPATNQLDEFVDLMRRLRNFEGDKFTLLFV